MAESKDLSQRLQRRIFFITLEMYGCKIFKTLKVPRDTAGSLIHKLRMCCTKLLRVLMKKHEITKGNNMCNQSN